MDAHEYQQYQQHYIEAIQKLDRVLQVPVRTLITIALHCEEQTKVKNRSADPHKQSCPEALYFPPWLSAEYDPDPHDPYLLTRAICCATLERIYLVKRRFFWLKDQLPQLEKLRGPLANSFLPETKNSKRRSYFGQHLNCLLSNTYGTANPLTASQVLRVLLYAGEGKEHYGSGLLALFALLWSLRRKFPDGNISGARIEPWGPTAYVTAQCIFPIETFCRICRRRADLYKNIQKSLVDLNRASCEKSTLGRWQFASLLDQLSLELSDLSKIAVGFEAFRECAQKIENTAGNLKVDTPSPSQWQTVQKTLMETIRKVGATLREAADDSSVIVKKIQRQIVAKLTHRAASELRTWKFVLAEPKTNKDEYWKDHQRAAREALEHCKRASKTMSDVANCCCNVQDPQDLLPALSCLENANRTFADVLEGVVNGCAEWCHSVIEREIAHASADNETDFDPAELVSAIAVAVHSNKLSNVPEIEDAIRKAKKGARSDGSWSPGQPYYTKGRFEGLYATTSDIIQTLAGAVTKHPDISAADDVFENYVAWLERTKTSVPWGPGNLEGWASERLRERNRIDLQATALAANALIQIRNLWEHRLWQLCEQRFTIVSVDKRLKNIDPVDLGTQHKYRLHRRLWKTARMAELDDDGQAEYSFVLHGPPGSSKTVLAQALSKEMWRILAYFQQRQERSPRLIRITPADFTRHGEDRCDFEARSIFDLLRHVRGVTILFDEIDDLLHKRSPADTLHFMELIIPAMLNRLADLREACPRQQICFLIGTNFVENIEPALLREGRIDAVIPVVYPDVESRTAMIQRHIHGLDQRISDLKRAPDSDCPDGRLEIRRLERIYQLLTRNEHNIINRTSYWPWMTLDKFIKEYTSPRQSHVEPPADVKEHLTKYNSYLARPSYLERLTSTPVSQELVNEFVEYRFTSAQTLYECCENLRKMPGYRERLSENTREYIEKRVEDKWKQEGRKRDRHATKPCIAVAA